MLDQHVWGLTACSGDEEKFLEEAARGNEAFLMGIASWGRSKGRGGGGKDSLPYGGLLSDGQISGLVRQHEYGGTQHGGP